MPLLPPLLLHYYITERCTCRCQFCAIWRQPLHTEASMMAVGRNLDEAAALGVRFVDLTGGEPLLHPDLPEMLRLARAAGLRTTLTTNGMLYPDRCHELAGLVDFLHFSLDAAAPAAHDRLRGAACFDQVMASIDAARALGETPDLIFTATPDNLAHLAPLAEFSRQTALLLIVNPLFLHHTKKALSRADLERIESLAGHPYLYINRAFHTLRRAGGNQCDQPRCRVVDGVIVIAPENELILPCYHFPSRRIPLESGLWEAWRSAAVRQERGRQGRRPECQGCTLNCYFDPSFHYQPDRYLFQSLAAKTKYSLDKYLRAPLARRRGRTDTRPAAIILAEIAARWRDQGVEL